MSYIRYNDVLCYAGTHNVQHITVTSKLGVVNISGDFVEGSTAIGILAIVYALTESDTLDYYLLVPRLLGHQRASTVFECIQSGTYNVSLFSMEEGDLPFNRAATKVRTLSVDQGRNVKCPSKSRVNNIPDINVVLCNDNYNSGPIPRSIIVNSHLNII